MENKTQIAVFGAGCFWCTEAIFSSLKGVVSVLPGYTGGVSENPTYEEVSRGDTDHVEAIKIEYDPAIVSYEDLLAVFFNIHDPTVLNRQGNDEGAQYRSVVFYSDDFQKTSALKLIEELNVSRAYDKPVVTELQPMGKFYPAEDYHKNYYENHRDLPYCRVTIAPKMEKLQERFNQLLRS